MLSHLSMLPYRAFRLSTSCSAAFINTVKLKLSGLSPAVFVSIGYFPPSLFQAMADILLSQFLPIPSDSFSVSWLCFKFRFNPFFQLFPFSFAFQLLFASCQIFRLPVFADIHSTRSNPSASCPASAFGLASHSFRKVPLPPPSLFQAMADNSLSSAYCRLPPFPAFISIRLNLLNPYGFPSSFGFWPDSRLSSAQPLLSPGFRFHSGTPLSQTSLTSASLVIRL